MGIVIFLSKGGTMKHKAISIIILMSFGVFSVSCYSIKPIDPHLLSSRNADDLEIRKVEKSSGETVEFSGREPARFFGSSITGTGAITRALEIIEIPNANIQRKAFAFRNEDKFFSVETRDGKIYNVVNKIVEQGDQSILYVIHDVPHGIAAPIKIALSEVKKVWTKQIDSGKLILAVIFIPVTLVFLALAIDPPHLSGMLPSIWLRW
jgi:hypothetical protein